MNIRGFFRELNPLVVDGTAQLADIIRHLVYASYPWILEELEFENDSLFLDPRLFSAFTTGNTACVPSLFGVSQSRQSVKISAQTESALVDHTQSVASINYQPLLDSTYTMERQGSESIVITSDIDPTVAEATKTAYACLKDPVVTLPMASWHDQLCRAWSILGQTLPELHLLLSKALRIILLFDTPEQNSFASLSAHGLAGLNVGREWGMAFCLDELAHQGGHVVFNAATSDTRRWLAVDARTPLPEISGNPHDIRDLYAAFHGLFTYTCILSVLDIARQDDKLPADEAWLASGRTAFYLNKFTTDRAILDHRALYTEEGSKLFECLAHACDYYAARSTALMENIELGRQPYTFCSQTFRQENAHLSPALIDTH